VDVSNVNTVVGSATTVVGYVIEYVNEAEH